MITRIRPTSVGIFTGRSLRDAFAVVPRMTCGVPGRRSVCGTTGRVHRHGCGKGDVPRSVAAR